MANFMQATSTLKLSMTGLARSRFETSLTSARAASAESASHVELEVLALPHVADAGVAHAVQRFDDHVALRIEHRRLEGHEDSGFVGLWHRRSFRSNGPD